MTTQATGPSLRTALARALSEARLAASGYVDVPDWLRLAAAFETAARHHDIALVSGNELATAIAAVAGEHRLDIVENDPSGDMASIVRPPELARWIAARLREQS